MRLVIDNVSVELGRLQKVNSTLVTPEFVPVAEINGEEQELISTRIYQSKTSGKMLGSSLVVGYISAYVPASVTPVQLHRAIVDANEKENPEEKNEVLKNLLIATESVKWKKRDPETGELEDSALFQRSDEILPKLVRPREELSNWKIQDYYVLAVSKSKYKNDYQRSLLEQKIFEKAEEWIAANQMGVLSFTHRTGRTTWVGFIYPIIREVEEEGTKRLKYGWILATSNTKIDWQEHAKLLNEVPQTAKVQALPEPEIDLSAIL